MNWKMAGTAVQGRRHIKANIPCQDKYFLLSTENISCISLADGAGSCKYSEKGAEISTQIICKYLLNHFNSVWIDDTYKVKKNIIHSIRTSLGKEASKQKANIDDYSSTLLFAAVMDNRFVCGHLGDGLLAMLKEGTLIIISPPESGEFANETYFTTSNNYQQKFKIIKGEIREIDGFVLMSDGTADSFLDKANFILTPVLLDIFDWLIFYNQSKVDKALLDNFQDVVREKTTDDCSIAILRKF